MKKYCYISGFHKRLRDRGAKFRVLHRPDMHTYKDSGVVTSIVGANFR